MPVSWNHCLLICFPFILSVTYALRQITSHHKRWAACKSCLICLAWDRSEEFLQLAGTSGPFGSLLPPLSEECKMNRRRFHRSSLCRITVWANDASLCFFCRTGVICESQRYSQGHQWQQARAGRGRGLPLWDWCRWHGNESMLWLKPDFFVFRCLSCLVLTSFAVEGVWCNNKITLFIIMRRQLCQQFLNRTKTVIHVC